MSNSPEGPQSLDNIELSSSNTKFNFAVEWGCPDFVISMTIKKTWVNRLKWWFLCKAFPFRIIRWDK